MKTKGIPIWEQYLEHIVLGVAFLVLVGFTAMQFVGSPNTVEVAGVGKVGPSDVDQVLESKAQEIAGTIQGPAVNLPDPVPVLAKFEESKGASISPSPALKFVWEPRISPVAGDTLTIRDRLFVVPAIAAPFDPINKQYFDTLPEETVAEFPDLLKVLPSSAPYDISWITAAAKFNAQDILRQFGSVGPNGEAPLPPRWFDSTVFLVEVRIEREELVDGKWGQSTLLEPIPGQLSFRTEMAGRVDASTRDLILSEVSTPAGRNSLIRPEFYTGAAAAWAPPGEVHEAVAAAANEDPAITDLKNKLARDRKEHERIKKRFEELGCPAEEPPKPDAPKPGTQPPPARGGGSAGGGEGAGSGGGRQIGSGPAKPTTPSNERECRRLRAKLKNLTEQIARVETQLAELEAAAPQVEEAPPEEAERLDEMVIWGHDINIRAGATYRYRFVVEVYNPLFLRANDLMSAQKHMAEQFALASAASEWSMPITADPPLRLFVTNARPAAQNTGLGQLPAGSALAEVYRFRDGRWWQENFSVQPGEQIGGVKGKQASVDYSTDWFVLDVVPEIAVDAEELSKGLGAVVLLQSLSEEGVTQRRWPRDDAADPERAYLRQEVQAAKTSDTVAKVK
jgi:hypothetical protein